VRWITETLVRSRLTGSIPFAIRTSSGSLTIKELRLTAPRMSDHGVMADIRIRGRDFRF
jgi:hypothetical protein